MVCSIMLGLYFGGIFNKKKKSNKKINHKDFNNSFKMSETTRQNMKDYINMTDDEVNNMVNKMYKMELTQNKGNKLKRNNKTGQYSQNDMLILFNNINNSNTNEPNINEQYINILDKMKFFDSDDINTFKRFISNKTNEILVFGNNPINNPIKELNDVDFRIIALDNNLRTTNNFDEHILYESLRKEQIRISINLNKITYQKQLNSNI